MVRSLLAVLLTGMLALSVTIPVAAFEGIHKSGGGQPKLNYDSLWHIAMPLDQSPPGQLVVEKCLEKYGGIDHLNQLIGLRLKYTMMVSFSPHPAQVTKHMSANRRQRTVRTSPGFAKERILNGDQAWRILGDSVVALGGADLYGQFFGYYALHLPQAMASGEFEQIKFGRRDNDSLVYIYMMKKDTLLLVAGISEDFMVRTAEGVIQGENGGAVYTNWFSDFRKVDGYLIPHHLVNISLGLEVGRSTLDEAEVNPEITEETYGPPAGADRTY